MNDRLLTDKIINIVCGCKTIPQLDVALKYIKQAKKNNSIDSNWYYYFFGIITALRGAIK